MFEPEFWRQVFTTNPLSWRFIANLIDIAVVWFLMYKLIMLVKGTKAVQLVKGVALFFVIRIVAELLGLTTITFLMSSVITYGVIALIIIFQPEVRKGLESLGRSAFVPKKQEETGEKIIQGYEKAVEYMSKRRIGALISIERKQSLNEYASTGIRLDADITGELLINIFIPNTPLHDGAVIIQNDKVAVSCAYLPLTESTSISKEFGTRHRAAIGLSEVTDALTIVVSEETGGISITKNKEFIHDISLETFGNILRNELITEEENETTGFVSFFKDLFSKGANKE
jgi:diadenylate cyclase